MASRNTTFKLTDDDLALLESLSDEMGCSRTDVLRTALLALQRTWGERRAKAQAFVDALLDSVPTGSILMIGLDSDRVPYATVDGRERRDDIKLLGVRVTAKDGDVIRVFAVDPDGGGALKLGVIQADVGGWLALQPPFPVRLARHVPA